MGTVTSQGTWTIPFMGQPLKDRGWTEALFGGRTQDPNWVNPNRSTGLINEARTEAVQVPEFSSGNSNSLSIPANVLGASKENTTTQTKTQQQSSGNFMDYYPGWSYESALADFKSQYGGDLGRLVSAKGGGAGGGGGDSQDNMILDAYNSVLNALGQAETNLGKNKDSFVGNVEKDYASGQETIDREQKELEESLGQQGRSLEKSGQSAYSEAIRNLNSLFQTMASRFGAGSSTGGAAGEIIGQEFLRNQGKMREQLETGRQSIAAEGTKLKNYVLDKRGKLDSWKREAIAKIDENFQAQLAEIALRRGYAETDKTKARIDALNNAVQRAREIEDRDRDFKVGLAEFAVQTMQDASGRTFTPQEIAGVVNDMLGQELNTFSSRTAPAGPGFSYNPSALRGRTEDEIRKAGVLS